MLKLFLLCALWISVVGYKDERCQPRRGPTDGQVSYTVRDEGLVARFRCNPGYKLAGSPFAVCLHGIWRHSVPLCINGVSSVANQKEGSGDRATLPERRKQGWKQEQNDSPPGSGPGPSTSGRRSRKAGGQGKKKKDKRKLKQRPKGKGSLADGQTLEQDVEFLSKLDLSCLIGNAGAGFIKAPEASHAVIKYARKRNERGPQNRYLLATYECVKGFSLKNKRNDRMFCSRSRWMGTKPKCQKQEPGSENSSESTLCGSNRGGCEHVCTELRRKVVCSCYQGFRLEGNRCIDIDECEVNNGDCEHICKNQLGSFSCSCPTGLQLASNGKSCVDVNECLSRNGHGPCQDTCTNHWGGYRCTCEGIPGTQLGEDNHTCEVIDECKSGVAGCSHSCINALGRAFCQCPPGLELGEDWKTCQDIDECDDEAIESSCEFGCINTFGSYHCEAPSTESSNSPEPEVTSLQMCSAGYRLDADGRCTDTDECREKSHNCSHDCINRDGGYECTCPDGYDLNENERTCDDYDECADDAEPEHNCSQRCINEVGSFRCECFGGYVLQEDGVTCSDVDECATNPCTHECVNVPGSFRCSCPPGYQTANETDCEDVDECHRQLHHCSHGCANLPGRYRCECPPGYSLADDEASCVDVNECESDNGGCHQICENGIGGRRCGCRDGFHLVNETFCEDVDECRDDGPCSHGCRNVPGSYECLCPEGYAAEGNECQDINECSPSNANCSHSCRNYPGGFECTCPPGYRQEDRFTCRDIDECATEVGPCSHICENTPGSFECSCLRGYRSKDDGTACEDINECADDNGNCSHICTNHDGGFRCSCPENFALADDNRTCSETDPCLSGNGGCSQICSAQDGVPICSCWDGYHLIDNATCEEDDPCSVCDHECERRNGSVACVCNEGYRLGPDERRCLDVDECLESPCSQLCANTDGGYQCDCRDGYRLSEADNRTCLDVDECSEWEYEFDYYDNELEDDETRKLCSHTCVNLPGGYTCYCPDGYVLFEDDRTCVDWNECLENNGGCEQTCVNYDGGYRCECFPGYLALDRGRCEDEDECRSDNGNCSHDCRNTIGGFSCHCHDGYLLQADNRTCRRECSFRNGLCSHTCIDVRGTATCDCPEGFALGADRATCQDVDECATENGGCAHECANSMGGYRCTCRAGYLPEKENCVLVDQCALDNGNCSHECTNGEGGPVCSCPTGRLLREDNKTCVCPFGYEDAGIECQDVDECQKGTSGCSGSCVNAPGSYRCECPVGYQLDEDNRSCKDVNECLAANGGCSGDCINTEGGYACSCREGYRLENGTNCVEEDPCQEDNGGCQQICTSASGRAECSCFPGYSENGTECNDVDECITGHNCQQECVNSQGSYECRCRPGYRSEGNLCADEDECMTGICGEKNCINTVGSYHCECNAGYQLINDQCIDINECILHRPCQGRCINTLGSYKCACHVGFTERNGLCSDINECEFENGGCSHICINLQGGFKCMCPHGYELHNTSCMDINECNKMNGACDHFCINTEGSYSCSCRENYYLLEDRKSCRISGKACSRMVPPPYGEVICPQFPPSTGEFPIYAECYIRCHRGHKLVGDIQHVCTSDGEWRGRTPECIPLPCPKLRAPENGHFIPSSCTTGKSPPSHHCILACNKGYHVQGRAVLTCLTSQQWNSPLPSCSRDTPPPYIHCSRDISIELPSKQQSVYVKIPQPKSNVDWWRYVEAHPSWAKKLEGEFRLGSTTIMFQARNPTSNLTAACRLQINVYDGEKPRVLECPDSFTVRLSPKETGRAVTWKEPIFIDNVKIMHVEKSKEPGSLFRPGYHPIRYTASDTYGNTAVCNFSITVKYEEDIAGRDPYRRLVPCPHVTSGSEHQPTYLMSPRCYVQKHKLTRVLSGFTSYPTFSSHSVRHQHDRLTAEARAGIPRHNYSKRRDGTKDEWRSVGTPKVVAYPKRQGNVQSDHLKGVPVFANTRVITDQRDHQSDLARWQDLVKKYRTPMVPLSPGSSRENSVQLLDLEVKKRFEEERLKDHEAELKRWRENLRRYHADMRRLQEDTRRYRSGRSYRHLLSRWVGPTIG